MGADIMTKAEARLKLAYYKGNLHKELEAADDLTQMERNHKGDMAEMIAIAWLMRQNFRVFRNVSCVGDADLVYEDGDQLIKVDVKCVRYNDMGKYYEAVASPSQNGVKRLFVDPTTSQVGWLLSEFMREKAAP
jgi:hypothetical protein